MNPEILIGAHKKSFKIAFFDKKDHIYKTIQSTKSFYEAPLLNYLYSMNLKIKIAIDIGSNIGNHAIFFGNFLAKHVICVEPNQEILPILKKNCEENITSYDIIPEALGSSAGRGEMFYPLEDNIGAAKVVEHGDSFPITTLDNITPLSGVNLVKIDVEGMELAVLIGGIKLLSTQHPHLVIEAATKESFKRVKDFLRELGYKPISKWNATPTYHFVHRPNVSMIIKAKFIILCSKLKTAKYKVFHWASKSTNISK